MANEPGLNVLIRSLLDAKGFEDLQARLQDSKTGLSDASDSANQFRDALGDMGGRLAEAAGLTLSLAAAVQAFKGIVSAAVEGEEALTRFHAAIASLGPVTEAQSKKNDEWIESIEKISGEGKEKLIPLFQTLVTSSGSVAAAQVAMQTALGMSARGMGDTGEIVNQLTRFMETGRVRGVGPLASEIRKLSAEGLSSVEVFTRLAEKFGDAGAAVDTHAMQIRRAKEEWALFKEKLGESSLTLTSALQPAMKGVATFIVKVIEYTKDAGAAIGAFVSGFVAAGVALSDMATGKFKLGKQEFADAIKNAKDTFREMTTESAADSKQMLSAFDTTSKGIIKGEKDIADAAKGWRVINASQVDLLGELQQKYKILENDILANGKNRSDQETALIVLLQKENVELGKLKDTDGKVALAMSENRRKVAELSKALDDEARKEAEARFKQELADMKRAEDEEAKSFKRRLKIVEDTAKQEKKTDEEVLKAKIAALQAEIAAVGQEVAEERGYESDLADAKIKLAQTTAEQKMKIEEAVAGGISQIGGELFGKSKEWAIANAIINTYEGATKALAQGGVYGEILAAIVIAAGLADVAKIESQNAPTSSGGKSGSKGFDDPRNDFAAYIGGQKWARDMVDHFGAGASAAGFSNQVVNNTTYNQQRSSRTTRGGDIHVKVDGMFDSGSSAQARKLARTLQLANTNEALRTPR